jgi:hypothetical protein
MHMSFLVCAGPDGLDSEFDTESDEEGYVAVDIPLDARRAARRRFAVSSGPTPSIDPFTIELPTVSKSETDAARLKATLLDSFEYVRIDLSLM